MEPKYICCVKDEGAVDHRIVTRWFKKFCLGYKNVDHQASSGKPKTRDSNLMLQTTEVILVSSTVRVSGEIEIS